VWEQHPQIEDVVPVSPNGGAGAPVDAYLEAAGGDALNSRRQSRVDL
jgi:hypothetical protein